MNHINFRGQRINNKEWAYGYPYKDLHDGKAYIIIGTHKTINHGNYPHLIEVIPKTVGQFTGRKDKHGIDVYEKDRIKHQKYLGDSETETITIDSLEQFFGDLMYDELEYAYDWDAKTIEIIGNEFMDDNHA